MRLSVNLDEDVYAVAKSLARADDCSISAAINKLIRRSLERTPRAPRRRASGFPVVPSRPVTAEDVARIEAGDDEDEL